MSLRKAIDDKCRDCTYDKLDKGSCLYQVATCCCTDCPLWPVRRIPRNNQMPEKVLKILISLGDKRVL